MKHPETTAYIIDGETLFGDELYDDVYEYLEAETGQVVYARSQQDIFSIIDTLYEYLMEGMQKGKRRTTEYLILRNIQYAQLVMDILAGTRIDEAFFRESMASAGWQPDVPAANDNAPLSDKYDMGIFDDMIIPEKPVFDSVSVPIAEKMQRIIAQGSMSNIHVIITCSQYADVKNSVYSSGLISRFPMKAVFQINPDDADYLVAGADVKTLDDNMVFFTDGRGQISQLKPYTAPTINEWKELI